MALTPTQLQELQNELSVDPGARNYANFLVAGAEDWQELTDLLNVRVAGIIVQETHIQANSLRVEVRSNEYPTGNSASDVTARGLLALYLQGVNATGGGSDSGLDVSPGSNLRAALSSIFGAGTATRAAWLALLDREGSRIEELFSVGVRVTRTEVQRAWRL